MSTMTAPEGEGRYDFHSELGITFDNSCKLLVPGFGYPVPIELPANKRFAHGFLDWSQNRLTAREISMLRLMNTITDRPQWHVDIHNPNIVAAWADEALGKDLISPAAWEWCLSEMRDKAALYEKSQITHVFDSASRICKSDRLTPQLLKKLAGEVECLPHPINPDMFLLVYGKTRVLDNGKNVGCLNAADYAGQGTTSSPQVWGCSWRATVRCDGSSRDGQRGRGRGPGGVCGRCGKADFRVRGPPEKSWEPGGDRFSTQYQWLPSEIEFIADGSKGGPRVKVSSYINNLHPRQSSTLYRIVEKCIEASILPWNEILSYPGRGRTPDRIRTYGVQWSPDPPEESDLEDLDNFLRTNQDNETQIVEQRLRNFLEQPDNPLAPPQRFLLSPPFDPESSWWKRNPSAALVSKYARMKRWLHPEPGISFTYQDWKAGRNNRAVVPARGREKWESGKEYAGELPMRRSVDEIPKEDHEFYTVALEREFAKQGLQVVVEIGVVELTPERPSHAATDWQLSGLPNDHIVATTVIHFSSENVTPSSMSFRVEADLNETEHVWGTDTGSNPHHPLAPLADIYGCESHEELYNDEGDLLLGEPAIQTLGTVQTPDGRLLAFPNVMQHRSEAIALLDPSRAGRRKYLKLHLVDPHYRICSTRNVPPQRYDWWYEAGLSRIDWSAREIPAELALEITTLVGDGGLPISAEAATAERIRRDIRWERRRKFEVVEQNMARYAFGEDAAIGGMEYFDY